MTEKDIEKRVENLEAKIEDMKYDEVIKELRESRKESRDKLTEGIKNIKKLYSDMGLDKPPQRSREEVITDLMKEVTKSFAPVINSHIDAMTSSQKLRLEEINQKRHASTRDELIDELLAKICPSIKDVILKKIWFG